MTQHGSFPDRPRGRRARHGSDTPDWQERDALSSDEREFPELAPVRDSRLSEVDNRGLPGSRGRGRHSAPTGPAEAGPWADQERPPVGQEPPYGQQAPYDQQYAQPGQPQPAHPQYGTDQYGTDQYGTGPYGTEQFGQEQLGGGQHGQYAPSGGMPPAQPTWSPPAPAEEVPYQQEAPRRGRSRAAARGAAQPGPTTQPSAAHAQRSWDEEDPEVTDDPMEAFSRRWARRGAESPGDARGPRRLWIIGGGAVGAVIVAVAVLLYFTVFNSHGSSKVGFGSLVTTFLPGEIQKVPDACNAPSASTLAQYLPGGQPHIAAPPLNGGADSQCTWTLDNIPVYRVIEVDVSAFSPSGLASGDGSATFAAIDAYAQDEQVMAKPAAKSGQPPATIRDIPGLGTTAFSATQIFNVSGVTTYKATVIVRYRNVIVTAVVNGTDHAVTSKGTYGPVSMSTLSAAAQQVATEATAQLTH